MLLIELVKYEEIIYKKRGSVHCERLDIIYIKRLVNG